MARAEPELCDLVSARFLDRLAHHTLLGPSLEYILRLLEPRRYLHHIPVDLGLDWTINLDHAVC
jgi:hypothetical protein